MRLFFRRCGSTPAKKPADKVATATAKNFIPSPNYLTRERTDMKPNVSRCHAACEKPASNGQKDDRQDGKTRAAPRTNIPLYKATTTYRIDGISCGRTDGLLICTQNRSLTKSMRFLSALRLISQLLRFAELYAVCTDITLPAEPTAWQIMKVMVRCLERM